MTHPQALGWLLWLAGDPEEKRQAGIREAEARVRAARNDGVVVSVPKSEMHPGKAAELLLAGASRKKSK